jgi:AraC-like DNA-binding protein
MKRGFFQSERSGFYLKSNPGSGLGYAAEVVEEIHLDDSPFLAEKEPEDYSEWKDRIEQLLKEELLYQDPDLSLFDLAKKLTTNVSLLSKVINRGFNSNFNDLINGYRIKQYVELLNKGEHKKQTLLSLAFECGFNSKTTFNRAFRKQTGLSPQQYIKTNKL